MPKREGYLRSLRSNRGLVQIDICFINQLCYLFLLRDIWLLNRHIEFIIDINRWLEFETISFLFFLFLLFFLVLFNHPVLLCFFVRQKIWILELTPIKAVFLTIYIKGCLSSELILLPHQFLLILFNVFLKQFARHEPSEHFLNFDSWFLLYVCSSFAVILHFADQDAIIAADEQILSQWSLNILHGFPIAGKINLAITTAIHKANRYSLIYFWRLYLRTWRIPLGFVFLWWLFWFMMRMDWGLGGFL